MSDHVLSMQPPHPDARICRESGALWVDVMAGQVYRWENNRWHMTDIRDSDPRYNGVVALVATKALTDLLYRMPEDVDRVVNKSRYGG